jgi:hypothetical protein
VQDADRWLQAQGNASPYQIAGGADVQNWDPSVKALTAFPSVLAELDRNSRWMSDLGNAYYNQPQDTLQAVQVMRQRAQSAGTLRSTPQEMVNYDQGNIELAPPDPQTVYVPQYNPWSSYGDPVQPYPGFSLLSAVGSFFTSTLGSSPLQFGLGIAMQAFNHTPFGWLSWGLNWLTQSVLFNHSSYMTQSTSVANWGLGGGMHAYAGYGGGRGNFGRPVNGSGFGQGSHRGPERPIIASNSYEGNRGYGAANPGYRGGGEAYNRMPAPISRQSGNSRAESRLAYGPEFYNGNGGGYSNRQQASMYRAPTSGLQRNDFGGRSSSGFNSFRSADSGAFRSQEKAPKSGGFHLFGGGNHEPKMSASNSFSGRGYGSFGGGKAPKAPKMSGGGRSFGGGHSGGGHSGGHHHG